MEAFNGKGIEFTPLLSESPLARIHITVRAAKGTMPEVDRASWKRASCRSRAAGTTISPMR